MSKKRPPKSVYRRRGLVTGGSNTSRIEKCNRPRENKTPRSSTKAARVQAVIDCWRSFRDFHPTVKRVTAQLGKGYSVSEVRQILEIYGPKNGIFLTEFQRYS